MKNSLKYKDKHYIINGKKYETIEDMPSKFQKVFADKNKNGIPDIVEESDVSQTTRQSTITINGKQYSSWDEVPAQYRRYMKILHQNQHSTTQHDKDNIKPANPQSPHSKHPDTTNSNQSPTDFLQLITSNPLNLIISVLAIIILILIIFTT
jgi:hypothetical protein